MVRVFLLDSEDDNRPEYDFGQTEEEFKEITDWVVEFKKISPGA